MPPPPQTPRLNQLDPAMVADDVCRLVETHAEDLMKSVRARLVRDPAPCCSPLWNRMHALTLWAQTGAGLDDVHGTHASLARLLYGAPGRDGYVVPGTMSDEPTCVILASQARSLLQFKRRSPVSAAELACLSSLSFTRIHQLRASGELTSAMGHSIGIAPTSARKFLANRSVPGF